MSANSSTALLSFLLLSVSWRATCTSNYKHFCHCMHVAGVNPETLIHPSSPIFPTLFEAAQQNTRWLNLSTPTPRPVFIFTPHTEEEIQAAVLCGKQNDLQIRVKSGGHDYENQSFLANEPYIIIDLINLRQISIDIPQETAWVQTGATLGEFYYDIAKKSPNHGFPGGTCPSVGTGGHISGGGFGMLVRKYGLAADNVLDARVVDVNGRILDRKLMGEDLFWALRGAGGASFGIVTSWKLRLVRVPPIVTVFSKHVLMNESLPKVLSKWQSIANKLPEDLLIRVLLKFSSIYQTVLGSFNSQFLGSTSELLNIMNDVFPELGLQATDCHEVSWINSTLYIAGKSTNDSLELLLNRTDSGKTNYKAKSDFVSELIPESGLEEMTNKFITKEYNLLVLMDPFGAQMDKIAENAIPFPHRNGTLYNIQYILKWKVNNATESSRNFKWMNDLYKYMEPYVTKNPRAAYINYKDLDLGANKGVGQTSYAKAKVWGEKYFKGNFERLVKVKSKVDPENYFRNDQSIPTLDH